MDSTCNIGREHIILVRYDVISDVTYCVSVDVTPWYERYYWSFFSSYLT